MSVHRLSSFVTKVLLPFIVIVVYFKQLYVNKKVFRGVAMHYVLVIVAWHIFWLQMEVRCQYVVTHWHRVVLRIAAVPYKIKVPNGNNIFLTDNH